MSIEAVWAEISMVSYIRKLDTGVVYNITEIKLYPDLFVNSCDKGRQHESCVTMPPNMRSGESHEYVEDIIGRS